MLTAIFVGVVAIGLVVAWIVKEAGAEQVATVGATAPDFSVALLDGGRFDLADHIANDGRPVVLNLWASWCPPCRAEIPEISTWSQENPDVYVIGVAVEDRDSEARALAAELQPEYDLAIGDAEFRGAYPSPGLPATFFIDSSGEVIEIINAAVTTESLDDGVAAISG